MARIPSWAGTDRVLLHRGNVYSPADPFATAMLVVGHEIAWIGSDGAALALADGVDEVVDLDGALVLPAFVDAYARRGAADEVLAQQGVALCVDGAEQSLGPGPLRAAALDVLVARTAQESAELLHSLQPADPRLLVLQALHTSDVAELSASGASVCLVPDRQGSLTALPLASIAAAGVRWSFGSGPVAPGADPWRTIAAAVNHPDDAQRISARAAFVAHTRGGWRALAQQGVGALVAGTPAHYAVWDVQDLLVQAPDDRFQAWSTDPRSGTPGLPDLSPGAPVPVCRRTVVWGRTIHQR